MKRILGYVLIFCLVFTIVPSAVFAEDTVTDNSHLITYEKPGPYDYVIDEDPMQITDEEFFGVWETFYFELLEQFTVEIHRPFSIAPYHPHGEFFPCLNSGNFFHSLNFAVFISEMKKQTQLAVDKLIDANQRTAGHK